MRSPSLALAVALWLGACTRGETAIPDVDASPSHYELPNGLDVVLIVDRRMPMVAIDLAYHVGSMHDGRAKGLAHLVEHLMFRGTITTPDGEMSNLLIEAGAVGTNAVTHATHTSFHVTVPKTELPAALWLEADRMRHLAESIDEHEVREEIQTTIDEWNSRSATQQLGPALHELIAALFTPEHPKNHARPEEIRSLSLSQARHFAEQWYGPANATLVLVGDLPDDVHAQVERHFGSCEGGERPPPPKLEFPVPEQHHIVHPSDLDSTSAVIMAWPTPGLYEPGDAEADVVASIINEAELDADDLVRLFAWQYSEAGQSMFVVMAEFAAPHTAEQTEAILESVIEGLRSSLPAEAIQRAKARLIVDLLRRHQTIRSRAAAIHFYLVTDKPADWLDEDIARFEAIDERAIADFVTTELSTERRVTMIVQSGGDPR